MKKRTVVCILDGFGLNPRQEANAVALAKKPHLDALFSENPTTTLTTFGEMVGLPEGQMGNSEVGHLNIGAGRVVEQWLLRISRSLQKGELRTHPHYQTALRSVSPQNTIHLVGLFSDGGVHSHIEHFLLLTRALLQDFEGTVVLHLITDGRDVSPHAALQEVPKLEELFQGEYRGKCRLGSVGGRFYYMDRDTRWERTQKAYEAIVDAKGSSFSSLSEFISQSYEAGVTDEFIVPGIAEGYSGVKEGDGVIFWNFRADRMRQLVRALAIEDFSGFSRSHGAPFPKERTLCMAEYDETFGLNSLFEPLVIRNYLGEVVANAGLQQLRVAETEKYPHVTYFLNGGVEEPLKGESRTLIPSPREVKTYDLKPEMSAPAVCEVVERGIRENAYDLIVVNFANCDMVGHTGITTAAVQAVETVDTCVGNIMEACKSSDWQLVLFADHGNAEQMANYEDGSPHTAHTTYPVPFVIYNASKTRVLREGGALCDVAPTVLELLELPQPQEMTGKSLLK